MSGVSASFSKAQKKSGYANSTAHHGGSLQLRQSLLPQTSLSKATGISHLSEKNGPGSNASILYLQKQATAGSATKKRENKSNNDYYTIQNTKRNVTSKQNSGQQTSRNQRILVGQTNHNSATTTAMQRQSLAFKTQKQQQLTNQHSKLKSPLRGGPINSSAKATPLDQISEKSNCGINLTLSDFAKVPSQSQVKHLSGGNTSTNRRSILNDRDNTGQRALSAVKQPTGLSSSTFSQISNFTKSSQNKRQIHPYKDNSNKNIYKKSMIVQQEEQYSPKPNFELGKNGVFRSPQQAKKGNANAAQSSTIFLSTSNSPLPLTSSMSQQNPNSRLNTHIDLTKQPQSRVTNSKLMHSAKQAKPQLTTTTTNSTLQQATNCLQIDLSSLSTKNDEDTATFAYGATVTQNAQALFQRPSYSKNSQRKKTSISQNKKTPLNLMSQSPQMHIGSSQLLNKSPKTHKNNNTTNRHSVLTQNNSSKAKLETPKINEKTSIAVQNQKAKTHKTNKHSVTSQIVKSVAPFEKKSSPDQHKKSQIKIDATFNQIPLQSKDHMTQQSHDVTSLSKNNIKILDDGDNFSFISQSQNKNTDIKVQEGEIFDNEDKLQVSEEKSNLKTQKSSMLQVISTNTPINEQEDDASKDSKIMQKQMSQVKIAKQAINIQLDDEVNDIESFPMHRDKFLEKNEENLLQFEINELKALKDSKIYFCGNSLKDRSQTYIKQTKNTEAEQEVQKSLDDEEGYYNVLLSDHLIYRYEVLKILGKGSFAQVVSCIDHKTMKKVAVKITRNTKIDHKFARSESKLLNYLMQNDPDDSHNVVRLIDEFYFRDHHCFVFELLYTDLFEHLKDNGFIGFESTKIRDYAIQILEALMFLEKHQIIHCDLKPENILLRDEKCEKLKLVDYGSGCFRQEQVYTYVQSRFYRAPEVILRIPYSEKVDIWSFGCILAELYTGEPLFPGNNEQEQLELIMELCGIPSSTVIDKSRKKDHYFDVDYSPFLIEDEELGILRIPESRQLEDAVPTQDHLFLDFMRNCLELDPEQRFSATQAYQHPWIQEGIKLMKEQKEGKITPISSKKNSSMTVVNNNITNNSRKESNTSLLQQNTNQSIMMASQQSSQQLLQPPMQRKREDEQDGVKGNVYEESPVRPIKEKPKKAFNFQTVRINTIGDNDSIMSTPKNEGGITPSVGNGQEINMNFQLLVDKESVINEQEVNKPHNISLINKSATSVSTTKSAKKSIGIKMIGKVRPLLSLNSLQYEIIRSDEELRESNSRTSGIASEANISPVNQHDTSQINNENTINKITITFYQKRTNNKLK